MGNIMRVADYIVDFFQKKGVNDFFMLSGGGIMHLTDGLACNENINVVCLHHEQAISMAIESYAKVNQNLGVGYFTTGPGSTNALTGLCGAYLDSVSCVFISGQAKVKDSVHSAGIDGIRQIGVQEVNIVPVVKPVTKYAVFIENAEDIRFHLEKAVFLAKSGRPGPVWIDVPLDIQGANVDISKLRPFVPPIENQSLDFENIDILVNYLEKAKKPVILAGHGVRLSKSIGLLKEIIRKYKIPVVTTYLGIDCIEYDDPQFIGKIGIKGDRAGNIAVQNSDLLMIIGTSLPVAETGYDGENFAPNARKVVIDIDLSSHKKQSISYDMMIENDANIVLSTFLDVLNKRTLNTFDKWSLKCRSIKVKYPVCLPEYSELKQKINMYYFVDRLSDLLSEGDAVVTDAGSAFYVGSQAIKIKRGVRYITSGGLSTMGYSLPASIGVCYANNRKRVMCITGDGSLQQNIQELQTLIHNKLPVKVFVFNNEGYLSIRFTQEKYFENRLIGEGKTSGISFPDLKKIAFAYDIKYLKAETNSDLDSVLKETIDYAGPVICEIVTPEKQLVIPTVGSAMNKDGQMESKPLHDMAPFLDSAETKDNMSDAF